MRAGDVAKALNARRSGRGYVARCPAHDDRHPSLSIAEGADGRLLLHCFAGCVFDRILEGLRHRVSASSPVNARPTTTATNISAETAKRRDVARRIWSETSPASGTLVETYFRSRAIATADLCALGYHPRLRHPSGAFAPAIVAKIVDRDGVFLGVHRTWLARDGKGKAALDPPRAMLGAALGGAVRLQHGDHELVVAEGLETALSLAKALPDRAVWAALSANGLRRLGLPHAPGALLIGADGDAAGRNAGQDLAERAQALGWSVRMMVAPDGLDWNDVARRRQGGDSDGA